MLRATGVSPCHLCRLGLVEGETDSSRSRPSRKGAGSATRGTGAGESTQGNHSWNKRRDKRWRKVVTIYGSARGRLKLEKSRGRRTGYLAGGESRASATSRKRRMGFRAVWAAQAAATCAKKYLMWSTVSCCVDPLRQGGPG